MSDGEAKDKLPRVDLELPRDWYVRYYFSRFLGRALSRIPNVSQRLFQLTHLINQARRAAVSELAFRQNQKKARGSAKDAIAFDSGYGYNAPEEELRVALMYKSEAISGQHRNLESPVLYEHVLKTLSDLVDGGRIRRVVNFGVSYAYLDSILAERFPHVSFLGVDRSKVVKELNERDFPLKNLSFFDGDIMDWIDGPQDLRDTVFFHMRTAVLLPQDFVEKLYAHLAQRQIGAIVGFEPFGLSRKTNSTYQQEYRRKDSLIFRDTMYIHNYAGIVGDIGYRMARLEYVKTGHVDRDYRILSFTAERDNPSPT